MTSNAYPLIRNTDLIFQITITNWYFTGVFQSGSNPLFQIGTVSSIIFNNNTFIGVSNSILRINKIDLSLRMDSQISNLQISNSSAVAIQFGNFINPTVAVQVMLIENITYSNSIISTSIDLINTENIVTSASVNMAFNNLKFDGIQFSSKGSMLALKHKMAMPVTISNSNFTNLESTVIFADSSGSETIGLIMQTNFVNCIFNNINGKYSSLINTNNKAVLEFKNSIFTNIYTYEEGAVLYAGFEKTSVSFANWVFQNNSAVQGTIFVIESESFINWKKNCTFTNNFSITSTIFMTSLNGYFELYNSSIYNNFATNNPVGEILDSANLWTMSNVVIYSNQALTISAINSELNTRWNYLWFVPSNFINYINANKLLNINTINPSLIQLILSSLSIQNNSKIYDQNVLFNIFISVLSISNLQLINLQNNIQMSSSNLTIQNTQIKNVTNSAGTDFIFANLNSILTISSSAFSNSSSSFMNLRNSQVSISNFTLSNVVSPSLLVQVVSSTKVGMSGINVANWSASNGIFFDFETSSNTSLSGFTGSQIKSWFIQILSTNVTQIDSFAIDRVYQPLIIKSSIIDIISNSSFTNNGNSTLTAGGAISMSDSKIRIINSKFINNTAISGGAISFECTSLDSCNLNISTSTFDSNSATSQGGAIYYNYNRPTIINTTFVNNTASYGPDFASYAVSIIMNGNISTQMIIDNMVSGVQYDQDVKLSVIDFDNQTILLNNSQIIINPVNKAAVKMRGTNSGLLRSGVATFSNLIVNTKPGSTNMQFQATTNAIDSSKVKEVYGSVSNNLISANFRFCKPGEIQLSDNTCSTWAPGMYSLGWSSTACQSCPLSSQCLGGNQIYVGAGYWRMSQNTSTIVECIYAKAWDGGYVDQEDAPVNWATGYTGILWNECQIVNGTKYSKVSDFECSKWPLPVYNAIRVTVFDVI